MIDAEKIDDNEALQVFLAPVRLCAKYKPAFGSGRSSGGMSYDEFHDLYSEDSFYSWLGLNSPDIYAAHKAAGGLTSVYRQLGIGAERLFRFILTRCFSLDEDQVKWSYTYQSTTGKVGVHTLDARLSCSELQDSAQERMRDWLSEARNAVAGSHPEEKLAGVVFEVRQGYKSADSKRQNADLRFGMHAYQERLLPVFAVFSNQVSQPVIARYRSDGMLVLTGTLADDPTSSTFAFFSDVVQYDLADLFRRNSTKLSKEVRFVVEKLLSA